MDKKIGFIGCGNMGKAMVGALAASPEIGSEKMIVSAKRDKSLQAIKETWNVETTLLNREVARQSDFIILAVNPNLYKQVIEEIADLISEDKVIITIAAGIALQELEEWFGKKVKIVKTMPNTPVLAKEGMSAICPNPYITEAELSEVLQLFGLFGECELLEEEEFHAFIALCGSSPAYVFVMIEAMADAAVKLGIQREKAYRMAEQSILGSAKLALQTGLHPGELKDMVCSPGGTTIEAVAELEKQGFRKSLIHAMEVCALKSMAMGSKKKQ